MIELHVTLKDELKLDPLTNRLQNLRPLLQEWRDIRQRNFNRQMDQQLAPDDQPLRSLSAAYQSWKDRNYPGKPKRVLTESTVKSYSAKVTGRNEITESIGGNVEYLESMDLPLLPDSWGASTSNAMLKAALQHLSSF